MKHKYRIVNKKRFFTFWFTIWLIAFIIITFFINHSKVYSSTYKQNYIEIVVKKGDTLWQIAKEHLPEDYDIRKMIHQIREVNNMEVADIYPGDLVKIPIIDMKNR
ncbi:MAG: LysM peptidoglycan-binding domain-containing protein [Tissierellia bacterium]|nr:LysM peptidoglycan-binding domain-containing protein [Tissierellia bacterium]